LNLAEEILSIEKTPSPKNEKLYIGCQIGLLVSGIRALYAIRVLCEMGMAEDQAMLPLRNLIEISANSVMLNKGNKIKNSEAFRDFYLIQEYKLLESASRYSGTPEERENWRKLLSERGSEIDKIKTRLKTGYKKFRKSNSWFKGGSNIYELTKKAGMESQYDMAYRHGSRVAHGTNIGNWLGTSSNPAEILIAHSASSKWASYVLSEASNLFILLMLVVDESVGGTDRDKIQNLGRETENYWHGILSQS
jgi:hypothetical protein